MSDDNDMFKDCSVLIKILDGNINSTIIRVYAYDPVSLHKKYSSSFDKNFANALILKGEIYNIST